jgi:hypothetical protein
MMKTTIPIRKIYNRIFLGQTITSKNELADSLSTLAFNGEIGPMRYLLTNSAQREVSFLIPTWNDIGQKMQENMTGLRE